MIFHCARIKTDSIKFALGKFAIKHVTFIQLIGVIIDDKFDLTIIPHVLKTKYQHYS